MVDPDVVAGKLAEVAERIEQLRRHRPETAEKLVADHDTRDLVSFNLMLAVQAALDLASHLIADEGWPAADTLREGFQRLAEHGVIAPETAEVLGQAAGLRNVIAHGYAGANPKQIHEGALRAPADFERFSREVSRWLSQRLDNRSRETETRNAAR